MRHHYLRASLKEAWILKLTSRYEPIFVRLKLSHLQTLVHRIISTD